jgi:hypothetical protein
MKNDATAEEWKDLYQAAAEFREIEPWKWVNETDIFGVQNPRTGGNGYCCIMGELGEVLALAVYLGAEGLSGYHAILDGHVTAETSDMMFIQDCLMASFENKDALEKDDKALAKKLGILAQGKRAWPMFRRYEPGYLPWFIQKDEVIYLTAALQQVKDVCLRLRADNALLHSSEKDFYLVRVYDNLSNRWQDAWLKPEPLKQKALPTASVDDLRLQRIKNKLKRTPAVWEVDFFYALAPIASGDRPYYPYAVMIADSESGFIHDVHLSEKIKYPFEFSDHLLLCIEKNGLPEEILVKRDDVFEFLKPIAMKLDIALSKAGKLPAVDTARRSMEAHLMGSEDADPQGKGYCGDDMMEEYLEKAGAEISIFGLYGLLYGCLAAPDIVMPSVFMPLIFGEKGAEFETGKDAEKIMGNIMELWNLIAGLDTEKEDILMPVFDYPENAEGIITRTSDALELAEYFMHGLELGGKKAKAIPEGLRKDYETVKRITIILYHYAELFEKGQKLKKHEFMAAMKAIDNAEVVIDGCIANIYSGLKEARLLTVERLKSDFEKSKEQSPAASSKTGRNEPCPCGSGKKYKKCCGMTH